MAPPPAYASVHDARSDFVRRANAVRPITTYLATPDSMLIMGSPKHHPIVITERAPVCLTICQYDLLFHHGPRLPWVFQRASQGASQLTTPGGATQLFPHSGRPERMDGPTWALENRTPFPLASGSCLCRCRPLFSWQHQPEAGDRPAGLAHDQRDSIRAGLDIEGVRAAVERHGRQTRSAVQVPHLHRAIG